MPSSRRPPDGGVVRLPTACACGRLTGDLVAVAEPTAGHAGDVICGCGKRRAKISQATLAWHESIASKFGAPTEIVLRSPAARRAIEVQNEYLKTRYGRDGRTLYDVITANLDGGAAVEQPPMVDDGSEIELRP